MPGMAAGHFLLGSAESRKRPIETLASVVFCAVMEQKHNPMYFAALAIAGVSLAASTWLLPSQSILRGWSNVLVFRIPMAIIGLVAYFWAIKRLNEENWSEEELVPVRGFLTNPFLRYVDWALVTILWPIFRHGYAKGAAALMFLLSWYIVVGALKSVVTPRTRRDGPRPRDWSSFKPLQSEHWGKQPQQWGEPLQ